MAILMKKKPFGKIISISGIEVTIDIDEEIYTRKLEQNITIEGHVEKLFVGTVGDIFLIGDPELKDTVHYAMFEEVKLVSDERNPTKDKAIITAKVIGYQDIENKNLCFRRGVGHYPRFDSSCYLLAPSEKKELFNIDGDNGTVIGKSSGMGNEEMAIDTNKFLSKHSVILGSTGSGKSCTVASIIQKVLFKHRYSHIIFFDLHNEYSNAFICEDDRYSVNKVTGNEFKLPYWLLSFEEFLSVFIGDINEDKNTDGIRILKDTILELKVQQHKEIEKEVGVIERININAPLYFDIEELLANLQQKNEATIWVSDNKPAIVSGKYLKPQGNKNVKRQLDEGKVGEDKVNKFDDTYGKCNKIIQKIKSVYADRRYSFLFDDKIGNSITLYTYLEQLLCIDKSPENQKQMSILDLSTIPSEVLPTIIGILARICFEYKTWDVDVTKIPLYLVFEEAQNYIPSNKGSTNKIAIDSISKIAKEGRKYGISQLIISQRPSDLCDSIVSQCSNFFVLRVTNPADQGFVKKVLPDHLESLTNMIPFFENGECLIAGECVRIPSKVIIEKPDPTPNSNDVLFSEVWKKQVEDYLVEETVHRWWEIKNE